MAGDWDVLVASHESGGEHVGGACNDKTATHRAPRSSGEEGDWHKRQEEPLVTEQEPQKVVFRKPGTLSVSRMATLSALPGQTELGLSDGLELDMQKSY